MPINFEDYLRRGRVQVSGWMNEASSLPNEWEEFAKAQNKKDYKSNKSPRTKACRELDRWAFYDLKHKLIKDMTVTEIQEAISDIKLGYGVYGQNNKIVTLERILKEKKNAGM